MEEMEAWFGHLGPTALNEANTALNRSVSANTSSPSRFRLIGLFRSSSRTWTPTAADEASLSPPALLKKKHKMRDLG
jgi:hypothetical protein